MVIRSLVLRDFRNYKNFEIEFHPRINIIYGKNGQGKTNLIESLYLLTHLKSFRTPRVKDIYAHQKKSAFIHSIVTKQNVSHDVKLFLFEDLKKVLLDNQNIKYTSEYIRNFFSLLFAPDQLTSFKEYPLVRRSFFDRVLFLIDQDYFQRIKEYSSIKQQKGLLLRRGETKNVFVWNQLLAAVIPKIIKARKSLIEMLNGIIPEIFFSLTGRSEELMLCYRNDFEEKSEISESRLLSFLTDKLPVETAKGFVYYGPHKDNFYMTLEGKKDKQSFSQGEYRISFIALLLGVKKIISQNLDFNPIILLDDISSELDQYVYQKTMDYISSNDNQVFLTTTKLPDKVTGDGKQINIYEGKLSSQN